MDTNILDSGLPSSQPESEPDHIFSSSQYFPSSPPSIISDVESCRKPKRPAPVTPRSFRRFFTPRSFLIPLDNEEGIRTNRRALQEISGAALNRSGPANSELGTFSKPFPKEANLTPSKKRKFTSTFDNPLSSSPLRRVRAIPPILEEREEPDDRDAGECLVDLNIHAKASKFRQEKLHEESTPPLPIRRSVALQTSGALFARSLSDHPYKKLTIRSSNYGASWQNEAADFYSGSDDLYACINQNQTHMTLPFCTTACNSTLYSLDLDHSSQC